ncbi:uncharacterized protein LOC107874299 [Capsicum annuum]|uniref:uncharacterized protein LOC107874299 n=1 Tax=Capsicum annuum TaxID=4072 RepID=UPI001FB06F3A|nr:uncharacterized protein LOC107874299 [Capsicum annuum]
MKRNIAKFMSKCATCQKVKIEHQMPSGVMQELSIPTLKWEEVNMDFVVGLPSSRCHHDSIWVVVDQLTKSVHFLPVHSSFTAEDYARLYIRELVKLPGKMPPHRARRNNNQRQLVDPLHETVSLAEFQAAFQTLAQVVTANTQANVPPPQENNSAAAQICDFMWMNLPEFMGREQVSPMKRLKRFGKKGKLSPCYVVPYKILSRIRKVAYEVDLPAELSNVLPIFHVSILK